MAGLDAPIKPQKAKLARRAVRDNGVRSFADLGACWAVNAGYTFDLLDAYPIERAYVLDDRVTALSRERGMAYPQVRFVKGLLGEAATIAKVPDVDALIMFDILLHQVKPDWDEFLRLWAKKARVLVVYNQMWKKDARSVRFIERGRDWYKRNVHYTNEARLDAWFARHAESDPKTGRPVKDVYNFWQWGITTDDLVGHVRSLGFDLAFFESYGRFKPDAPGWIENEGFIFARP
jgi:hypothetical protein